MPRSVLDLVPTVVATGIVLKTLDLTMDKRRTDKKKLKGLGLLS